MARIPQAIRLRLLYTQLVRHWNNHEGSRSPGGLDSLLKAFGSCLFKFAPNYSQNSKLFLLWVEFEVLYRFLLQNDIFVLLPAHG
jgi:hypothetical protein